VDLKDAADQLGVHYQTAYRWVRDGALSAVKVGASYQIDENELAAFAARRSTPVPPPKTMKVRDWEAQSARLHQLLVEGDELSCRALIDRLYVGGTECLTMCERLMTPALYAVGEDWAAARITVAHEHRASAICDRLLTRASPHPRGRPRGAAVVCTPPGEEHGLPAAMAAMTLRSDRWKVHHLGTQVPAIDLKRFAEDVAADLVVLSVTMPESILSALSVADTMTDVRVLIGGRGRSLTELRTLARGDQRDSESLPG
jgi:excisionase family DNA binding protein